MRPNIAPSLLIVLLVALQSNRWWILRQKEESDLGLSKAFSVLCVTIDALLVNACIHKETGHGFSFDGLARSRVHPGPEHRSRVQVQCPGLSIEARVSLYLGPH